MPRDEGDEQSEIIEGLDSTGEAEESEAKPAKAKPSETEVRLTKLEKELDQRDKRISELQAEGRYWYEKAKGGRPDAEDGDDEEDDDEEPAEPDTDEEDTAEKFVDDIAAKGVKALLQRGMLTKKEALAMIQKHSARVAREAVAAATRGIKADAALLKEFPELENEKSELWQKTGEYYREMVREEPRLKNSPKALALAAKAAKADLKPGRNGDEEARRDRVRRSQGDLGDRGRSDIENDGDEDLSPMQLEFLRGMKVSPDDFRAERTKLRRVASR